MSTKENTNMELIILEETRKIVEFNKTFEQLKGEVVERLKEDKYNSIVTMENFKAMKETSQELGKIAKQISDFRILKVKEESTEIQSFEKNFKEITQIVKAKQDTIKVGLDVFEEQTRQQVKAVCKEYLEEQIELAALRSDFADINIEDMTLTGYMTAKGLISTKGKIEIESRVNFKLALQNKIDLRLSNLENVCFRAGIEPLSKEHIQGFLFDEDANYDFKLNNLIETETKRNEAARAKIEIEAKIKAEKEAKDKLIAEQNALKAELAARYQSRIRTATIEDLIIINLELKSYPDDATYELKNLTRDREIQLENEKLKTQGIDETPQENHLKEIMKEPIKESATPSIKIEQEKPLSDEKIVRTVCMQISVKATIPDDLVLNHIFKMIDGNAEKFRELFKVN